MIRAWRIVKARHAAEAFSGAGGLISGGRWHLKGGRVVYAASSLALAALEVFVHLNRAHLKIPWVVFEIGIPDPLRIEHVTSAQLPRNWRHEPPMTATARIGSEWLRRGGSAVLRAPSAIIPTEYNYLIKPAHADFRKIRTGPAAPFNFNPRMWK